MGSIARPWEPGLCSRARRTTLEMMAQRSQATHTRFLMILAAAFLLGICVAIGVYYAWVAGVVPPRIQGIRSALALLVCPPFVLSIALVNGVDSGPALVLVVFSMVLANAVIYAGVAAGAYFAFGVMRKKR